MAAINCADPKNHNTCVEFGITYFPTLKFIPAYAIYATKDHDARLVEREENSLLIKRAIDFIDSHTIKPPQWPQLSALKSKTINDLFLNKNAVKYALLVLENKDSYVGRKVSELLFVNMHLELNYELVLFYFSVSLSSRRSQIG